jgi:pyridoxine 5-phosphate synthase
MSRLAIDLDPIAIMRNFFAQDIPDPAHILVLAEMGGVESIVCYLRDDLHTVNDRDVRIMSELTKTHLNVRTNINEENIRKLLKIKPNMITFVSQGNTSSLIPQPINLRNYSGPLKDYIIDLRANDILTSIFIEPDINDIKSAGKLEIDYIEVNTYKFARSEDLDTELAELENIQSLVLAANRLGMGVNASGGLNQENIRDLAQIAHLDDIVISLPVIFKALSIGMEQAIRDFISIM